HLATLAPRANSHHPAFARDYLVDHRLSDQHCARLFGLFGQVAVEYRAQRRERMVVIRRLEIEELERERKLIALRKHRETLFDDVALDAACSRKVREVLAEHGRVQHTTEHRL